MNEIPEKNAHPPVVKFPFKFSPLMIAVLSLLLALCAAGFALTTWWFLDFLKGPVGSAYEWMKFILLYLVSGLLSVLVVAMLIRSQYLITDTRLTLQFGFIKSSFELKRIRSVRLFRGSRRLAVYFDDFKTKFTVIVVKESWYEAFVKELLARNESIEFDFTTAEEEEQWKNNRKK